MTNVNPILSPMRPERTRGKWRWAFRHALAGASLASALVVASSARAAAPVTCGNAPGNNNNGHACIVLLSSPWTANYDFNLTDASHGPIACAERAGTAGANTVVCHVPSGSSSTGTSFQIGWQYPNLVIPGGSIRSIAIHGTAILILDDDGNLRRCTGNIDEAFKGWQTGPTGPNYGTCPVWIAPADPVTGQVFTMKQVVSVWQNGAAAPELFGLTTGGRIHKLFRQQLTPLTFVYRWGSAPSQLPTNVTWTEISHGPGSLVARSSSSVYSLYQGNKWLPALPNGLSPISVGGRYALTNYNSGQLCDQTTETCPGSERRLYKYNLASNSWQVFAQNIAAVATSTTARTEPVIQRIVDGASYRAEGEFWFWHRASRLYFYAP